MDVFDATWVPSSSTKGTTKPRVLRAQFGDGYSQEVLDGIHPILRTWDLVWNPIHADHTTGVTSIEDINAFLEAHAGQRFYWTQPHPFDNEGQKVFRCREWSFTYDQGLIAGMEATFEQTAET